jgi:hypothetical protein
MQPGPWLAGAVVALVCACGGRVGATSSQIGVDASDDTSTATPAGADGSRPDDAAVPYTTSPTEVSTSEGGAIDGSTSAITPGCPPTEPTAGQPCSAVDGIPAEHFYCHYFPKGASCANEWKCSNKDGDPTFFFLAWTNCGFAPSACAEGLPCGEVGWNEACVVVCDHACSCSPSGALVCSAAPCP